MNVRLRLIAVSLLSATLAGCCFTGCTTMTPGGHKVVDPLITERAADEAAYFAGIALKDKYENELTLTANALDALANTGGGTVEQLREALAKLPTGVTNLSSDNSELVMGQGAVLLNRGGSTLVALDKSEISKYYVLPIARGLAAGLHRALATKFTALPRTALLAMEPPEQRNIIVFPAPTSAQYEDHANCPAIYAAP